MAVVYETAYRRLKADPSRKELESLFTPTSEERDFAQRATTESLASLAVLVHLKVFQQLGYFPMIADIPEPIIRHVGLAMRFRRGDLAHVLAAFDAPTPRHRFLKKIRALLKIRVLDESGRADLKKTALIIAETKHTLEDIVNALIEELIRLNYELPALGTLKEIAAQAREIVHQRNYDAIGEALKPAMRTLIDDLLVTPSGQTHSVWQSLKRDPKKPTNPEVRLYLQHIRRLSDLADQLPAVTDIPVPRLKLYRAIARASDASEIAEFKPSKRYALATIFIRAQYAKTLDDAADLFIRLMQRMESGAMNKLTAHQLEHAGRAEALIGQLKDLLEAFATSGSAKKRLETMEGALHRDVDTIVAECDEHLAYAGKNLIPFLMGPYAQARSLLFNCLEIMKLKSSSKDTTMERLIGLLLGPLRHPRREWVDLASVEIDPRADLSWMPALWRRNVFSDAALKQGQGVAHRKYLELAILTAIKEELKSGDLFIPNGEKYDDFRESLVDNATLKEELPAYGKLAGISVEAPEFVRQLRDQLTTKMAAVNDRFSENVQVEFENGRLKIHQPKRLKPSPLLVEIDAALNERMTQASIIDVIVDVTRWLGLDRYFQPLAGTESRLSDHLRRVVTTIFCYGCNLGPVQTARSVRGMSRRQISWLNLKYVTEDVLDKVITEVINAYKKFELPTYWGSGKHVSVDGTKWEVYEQNTLSEYHIRYGGYGGIGYYHVSDTYIALFSHFIACGVYEAVYMLDGLMSNASDIRPTIVHGDTHSQSFPVFALAHLLGIQLMPRIRHLNDLVFFKADATSTYANLQSLVRGTIDWNLIETHFEDMMRVVLSVHMGKISASTILRRLGTYSQKNKHYFAFRELGRAIRTLFLLDYIDREDLRVSIHAATNKSEQFNNFSQWVMFGNNGVIAENLMHEQRKIIKYGQLVANMVVLHNVAEMTAVLEQLQKEGRPIDALLLAWLGPYRTSHLNRFGDYDVDVERDLPPLDVKRLLLRLADEPVPA